MNQLIHPNPDLDHDDPFNDTRMSFGDHLDELRTYLLRAIKGFVLGMILSFFIGKPILAFIAKPVEDQLESFYERYYKNRQAELIQSAKNDPGFYLAPITYPMVLDIEELRTHLGLPKPIQKDPVEPVFDKAEAAMIDLFNDLKVGHLIDHQKLKSRRHVTIDVKIPNPQEFVIQTKKMEQIVAPTRLSTLSVQEAFIVYFKVCLMAGFVLSCPWVFYQLWAFIAKGLYPHEKKLVRVYLPASVILFLVGVAVCEFLVIPRAIEALLWFNEYLGLQPDVRLNEWLGFAIMMPLVFGLSFQIPLVMMFLAKIGVVDADKFRYMRKMAWFAMAVFSAVFTPSTDALSMLYLWVPMVILYEVGIFFCPKESLREEMAGSENENWMDQIGV